MNFKTYNIRPVQKVYAFEYPYANELNPKLHQYIETNADKEHSVNTDARLTEWHTFTEDFLTIASWVKKVIPEVTDPGITNGELDDNNTLELSELWGVIYEKGDKSGRHNHYPNRWSFVYYVNTPEGSAPLIICGDSGEDEISAKPVAGGCIVFPAWMDHYVPENNCTGRSSVVGNFIMNFKDVDSFINSRTEPYQEFWDALPYIKDER
jgi:hypothetical protein